MTPASDRRRTFQTIRAVADRATRAVDRFAADPGAAQHDLLDALLELGRSIGQLESEGGAAPETGLVDPLTGCPNRYLFQDRLNQALLKAKRDGTVFPVLVLDLDRFKEVNETIGHRAGDAVLCQVADRLRGVLRESDTAARLGSDEFGILLGAVRDVEGALQAAERITEAFAPPMQVEGHTLDVEVSIGIATYPSHGRDIDTLLRHADIALSNARRTGSTYSVFASEEHEAALATFKLAGQIRDGVERDEFVLHYQPKVSFTTGGIVGVEALVRWQHPEQGLMMPGRFLPLVERSSLMAPLTLRLVDKALAQAGAWLRRGLDLHVAVNLSPRILHQPDLPERIEGLLGSHKVPASSLRLEITENAIMIDETRALAALDRLWQNGIVIAIDDFGTGHSSLTNLRRLPVHELKIDRSFVLAMAKSSDDAVIVRSLIDLGRNLGLQVVAEGVEDETAYRTLQGWGCHKAQGYYIARPMPADALDAWLVTSPWGAGAARVSEPA